MFRERLLVFVIKHSQFLFSLPIIIIELVVIFAFFINCINTLTFTVLMTLCVFLITSNVRFINLLIKLLLNAKTKKQIDVILQFSRFSKIINVKNLKLEYKISLIKYLLTFYDCNTLDELEAKLGVNTSDKIVFEETQKF